ncbi:MaoC/PaaZ C-terminal domain-containing protein [Mycolicibacterium thermoresistibile]
MSLQSESRDLASVATDQLLYAEDLAVGDWMKLGTVEVSRDEIIEFARRFDPLPIHLDAANSPFGDVIASGMHTMALFSSIASPSFISRLALVAGKGAERLQFPRPVRPDTVLTGSVEIIEIRMRDRRADVHCRYEMVDPDGEVVMTMVGVQVVRRRQATS